MTYDALQMGAVLTRCTQCGKDYYMTKPNESCIACRRKMRVCPVVQLRVAEASYASSKGQ
jgi:hypothetical protein